MRADQSRKQRRRADRLQGQVIGIPTLAARQPAARQRRRGERLRDPPSDTVIDITSQIVRYGRVVNSRRAALGASLADSVARPGALVVAVQEVGPPAAAGIRVGNVIEQLDGKRIADSARWQPR
jgi:S1-C subfamily serine protease